jgi:hypothetical protein
MKIGKEKEISRYYASIIIYSVLLHLGVNHLKTHEYHLPPPPPRISPNEEVLFARQLLVLSGNCPAIFCHFLPLIVFVSILVISYFYDLPPLFYPVVAFTISVLCLHGPLLRK